MTAKEQIAQLKAELAAQQAQNAMLQAELTAQPAENTALRADNGQLREQMLVRLVDLEGRLAKDSHNNSKPPSSDGPGRKQWSQRHRSEKKTGGQPGHAGSTLIQVVSPDEVVHHRPVVCCHCQQALEGVAGRLNEGRQMHDLPEVRLLVREHQVEEVRCPSWKPGQCGELSGRDGGSDAVWAEPARLGRLSASVPVGAPLTDVRTARRPLRLSALGGDAHGMGAAGSADPGTDRRAHWRLDQRESTATWGRNGRACGRQAALDARQQYAVADPSGLAREARQAGVGGDRYLAALWWAGYA